MPKAIKKRVAKKTGIKEEEVKSAVARALENIKSRKRLFTGLLSGTAVAIFMVIVIFYIVSEDRKKAYALEREAYQYYYDLDLDKSYSMEERMVESLNLFGQSVELRSTPSAQFYIGNIYFNLGDYDKAVIEYNKFIGKYKDKYVLLPLVYQKLASAYVKQDMNDEAFGALKELAERFPLSPWIPEAEQKIEAEEKVNEGIKEEAKKETAQPEVRTPEEPASEAATAE